MPFTSTHLVYLDISIVKEGKAKCKQLFLLKTSLKQQKYLIALYYRKNFGNATK